MPIHLWKKLALLLVFFAAGATGRAAGNARFIIDNWQTDAGLPNNAVNTLRQSRDRYLWIGTSNGLARFDGVRFTTFRDMDNPGLRDNRILSLLEDTNGALWIGTREGGLARMMGGQFTSFTTGDGLSSDCVNCLAEDRRGGLWIGTASGLDRRWHNQFSSFLRNDGLPDDQVWSVIGAADSSVFFGTGNGLGRIKSPEIRATALADPALAGAQVKCLLLSQENILYAGGERGFFQMTNHAGRWAGATRILTNAVICAVERSKGEIWCGTEAGRLLRVVSRTGEVQVEANFNSVVKVLYEDQEKNLWAGTQANGLYRLKPRELQLVPLPEARGADDTACCFQGADGELRLLAGDRTIYTYEDGKFVAQGNLPLTEDASIQSVVESRAGELWIGTRGDGLLHFNDNTISKISTRDGLSDDSVDSLLAEVDGSIWVGTHNGGLNHIEGKEIKRFNTPWGFSGEAASAIVRDRAGVLWVGTTGGGLFEMAGSQFTHYSEKNGLPGSYIRTLMPDDDGSVWVGTSKGLCREKDGRLSSIAGRGGLASESVMRLADDHEGNLWVGSDSGIYKLRKEEINAFCDGRATFANSVPYGQEDGLPVLQCLPDVAFQAERGVSKLVWFLTIKGLVLAKSGADEVNRLPPVVLLETATLDGNSVPLTGPIRVPPGNERVQFQFNALCLTAPGKIKFRYQLEGLDRGWSDPTTAHSAEYLKLPPGKYKFRATACNNDGIWDLGGAMAEIVVVPFWWATATFRLTILTGILAVGIGIYSLKLARQRALEQLRVRIARDLHDEVGSSLWSITLLSRMLAKHGSLQTDEREDLEEIHRIASQTSNSIRDIIWLINPAFDTVQDLLLRTQDFARTVLRGVEYRLVCEGTDLTRRLRPELRQNLFMLFKEALTNIARHSNATVAEVRIQEAHDHWRLVISDNGVGFKPDALVSGSGLRNLQSRAKKFGGNLEIESAPGQGTKLIFSVDRL